MKDKNTRYTYPSIMKHWITFTSEFYHLNLILHFAKFKCGGWTPLKTSHAMLLICLGYLYLHDMLKLAKSRTNKKIKFYASFVHHTCSCFYFEWISLFSHASFSTLACFGLTIELKHTCIELGCTYGLTTLGKLLNFW